MPATLSYDMAYNQMVFLLILSELKIKYETRMIKNDTNNSRMSRTPSFFRLYSVTVHDGDWGIVDGGIC